MGTAYRAEMGIPQGDPLSMMIVAMLMRPWLQMMKQENVQAKILADADISILYLSTFFSDFTLVQRADVDRAAAAFEEAGFECMRQSQSID